MSRPLREVKRPGDEQIAGKPVTHRHIGTGKRQRQSLEHTGSVNVSVEYVLSALVGELYVLTEKWALEEACHSYSVRRR